ncbi:MAG: hypothetical protein L0H59_08515, partial [Tomitella sp.]|nr:hypothetical protein [Tomitella sp.]
HLCVLLRHAKALPVRVILPAANGDANQIRSRFGDETSVHLIITVSFTLGGTARGVLVGRGDRQPEGR